MSRRIYTAPHHAENEASGEHFRHAQNVSGSRAHLRAPARPRNLPTLPVSLIYPLTDGDPSTTSSAGAFHRPPSSSSGISKLNVLAPPGPQAPRSWLARLQPPADIAERDAAAWRAAALAQVFSRSPATPVIPALTLLCLRALHAYYGDEPPAVFAEDVLPHLAPHLRRELVRDTAVRAPLSGARLASIYGDASDLAGSGADGEIVIVGPQAALRADWLAKTTERLSAKPAEVDEDWDAKQDWDDEVGASPTATPLHTLALISTPLPASLVSSLPATLTRLALLALPQPVQIHRLPSICPLMVFLDLSFNGWLASELSPAAVGSLARVEWARWARLEVLGVRECGLPDEMLAKVNESRWRDVEILR